MCCVFSFTIILILFLFFSLLNGYYKFVVIKDEQEAHIKRGRSKNNEYDIVAFGSSYARYAFDFSDTGLIGYNFGFVAQFFYYTDKMIRAYSSSFKDGCIVVITIPALCFAEVGNGMYNPQRYVTFLSKKELGKEFSPYNYVIYNWLPLLISPEKNCKKLIKYLTGKDKNDEYYKTEINSLSVQETNVKALLRVVGWMHSFGLLDTQTDYLPKELEIKFKESGKVLTSMIQFCQDNGFRPVLVVPPVSSIMNSHIGDNFINKVLYDNIKNANIQEVPVFDYLRDSRFGDKNLYSYNADFLNTRGRKLFSDVFVDDLRKIGYVREFNCQDKSW